MQSFQQSINTFKDTIKEYIDSCKKSDFRAKFSSLFGKSCGGKTGRERAVTFLMVMNESISKGNITRTKDLIDFAIKYSDRGNKLSGYIWKSIREVVGFTDAHIRYLAASYANDPAHQRVYHDSKSHEPDIEGPSLDESIDAIERLINGAISGTTDRLLVKYLNSTTLQPASRDYGRSVLHCLNLKIPEVELKEITTEGRKFTLAQT